MKKLSCFIFSLLIMLSACVPAFASSGDALLNMSIDKSNISNEAPAQFGVNLDGVTSSNFVENGSFEDGSNGWVIPTTEVTLGENDSMHQNNKTYNVVTVDKSYLLKNECYGGASVVKGESYDFSFFVRNIDFEGTICVWLDGDKNKNEITQLSTSGISKSAWTKFGAELVASESEIDKLAILFEGTGSLEIDFVSLVPQNSYGYNNQSWKGFGIRQDVFDALQNIKPAFVIFSISNSSWKNTIGSVHERDNNEFGYHEFLQFCSDLNTVAIPTLNANKYKSGSNKFKNYKQDILDLIEYANSNWVTSYYGSLRASNGAEEPFNLKYIRLLGNGDRFNEIKSAIEEKYSNITVLSKDDIAVVKNENNNIEATINNINSAIKNKGFVMFDKFFDKLINVTPSKIAYSTDYYAQMLITNNQGSKLLETVEAGEEGFCIAVSSIEQAQNVAYVSVVNSGSAFKASIDVSKLDGVTSASMQYVSDGYATAYNDVENQYVVPVQDKVELGDASINVKIPENSVCVIRITFNNASEDVLFSLPENISLKAKNYVPPVIIAVIVSLAVAIPLGSVIGFIIYKKVLSKKTKENTDE